MRRGRFTLILGTVLAAAALGAVAFAGDTVTADGDVLDAQSNPVALTLAPGASVTKTVSFTLTCNTQQHLDSGETVALTYSVANSQKPADGSLSGTNGGVGPRSTSWPNDGSPCPNPAPSVSSTATQQAQVTITAPSNAGTYTYQAVWLIGATGTNSQPDISGSNVKATYNVTVSNPDTDGDGKNDDVDNCPNAPNSDQANNDGDSLGDACDPDDDNDTVADGSDNCQFDSNANQANNDGDSLGDACDPDDDNDGVADTADNCPLVQNPGQADNDGDGRGLACDSNDYKPEPQNLPSNASGNEGSALSASGSFTDGDGPSSLSISKQSGAGIVTDNHDGTWSWSYTPDDGPASGTVVVQADDGEHALVTESFNWSATNVAPSASISNSGPISEGSSATISLSGESDPSSVDTAAGFHYAFSCSGADLSGASYSGSGASASQACPFADNGTYTVSAAIIDKDGGLRQYTDQVTVNNVAPSVSALALSGGSGLACVAGNQVSLSFSFSDPGVNDNPWAVDINWGDGQHTAYNASATGAQSKSHTYSAGSYAVSVSVTDKDGGAGSNSSAPKAVSLLYATSGLLQPMNADKSSNFKLGSTFPLKLRITDCAGSSVGTLAPDVDLAKVGSGGGTVNEVSVESVPDPGDDMRYDATAQQYIYNLSSKRSTLINPAGAPLDLGSYRVTISHPTIQSVYGYFDIVK
ncbi:MAG: PKD domain-containing protein [Actinomycetota bacterium]|nr:PKD domain-containing protein [Actinomycetota bacterium]